MAGGRRDKPGKGKKVNRVVRAVTEQKTTQQPQDDKAAKIRKQIDDVVSACSKKISSLKPAPEGVQKLQNTLRDGAIRWKRVLNSFCVALRPVVACCSAVRSAFKPCWEGLRAGWKQIIVVSTPYALRAKRQTQWLCSKQGCRECLAMLRKKCVVQLTGAELSEVILKEHPKEHAERVSFKHTLQKIDLISSFAYSVSGLSMMTAAVVRRTIPMRYALCFSTHAMNAEERKQKLQILAFKYRGAFWTLLFLCLLLCARPSAERLSFGLLLVVLGQILRFWGAGCIVRYRSEVLGATTLVTWGPYALTRNPLYIANGLLGLGWAWIGGLWTTVLFAFAFYALYCMLIIPYEENFLQEKFGAEYTAYCTRVGRFVPACLSSECFSLKCFTCELFRREIFGRVKGPYDWSVLLKSEVHSLAMTVLGTALLIARLYW